MKPKKIGKGQPLNELVKGSLTYTMERIRTAFRNQFRNVDRYWNWYICEIFADYVIVCDDQLPPDEFYQVAYALENGAYVFAAQDAWEIVELTYQSRTANEHRKELAKKGGQIALVEGLDSSRIELLEAQEGKPRRIKMRGMTADIINNNNRRYPTTVLAEAVKEAQTLIAERRLLAESNHPSDKSGQADILESLIRWDSITFEGNEVLLEGEIIPTKGKGENLIIIMEHGVYPRVSQRARGKAEIVEENGKRFVQITELHITGYDLVMDPGDPTADTLVFENRNPHIIPHKEGTPAMDDVTLEKLREQHPELVKQIEREHDAEKRKTLEEALRLEEQEQERQRKIIAEREAALRKELGLGETDDLKEAMAKQQAELKRLQEADQARQVAEYIEKAIGEIKYADILKKQFGQAIKDAAPKTIDEAKQIIIGKRKEYDALQSNLELAARGRDGGFAVLGPVLERERGIPEFAKASFHLNESLARYGQTQPRDLRQPKTVNERFAVEYMEKFDRLYRHHLLREAREFEEAETTSDLNLPYSVARAVMAEALPELVAISIFDVQLTDQAPTTNVWFEAYSGESGSTATVTDEVVVASNPLGQWVNLANKRLRPGTVVLTNSGATVTYVEGTDYVVDYANGRLMALATITAGQSLLIDYVSDQIRKGENVAIERAKNTLTTQPLTIAADRLAMEISTEAVVFSRAALGYDATNRTLMRLIKEVQRKIDSGLFYLALSAVLRVTSNSAGTWTAASDTLDKLVSLIGGAKVKVANRFYDPTFVLMSKTNSDRLSNWSSFTASGQRPDADLNAAGYVGRVKGLPVFDTANFQDGYVLVGNRELVAHRVFQPMQLKGPYASYSSNKLVGAEQYYAEEFNGSETFVPQKGSSLKVA